NIRIASGAYEVIMEWSGSLQVVLLAEFLEKWEKDDDAELVIIKASETSSYFWVVLDFLENKLFQFP
ncbi:hypothetical protein PJP07_30715, partial [Mycobacterium kansasii]